MTSYRTSMRQALEEMYQNLNESNLDLMRKAAGGAKQTLKMKDGKIGMDSFTASAIMQIYDKVNDKNRKTMENLLNDGKKADIVKLMKFAMSKVNASYEEFEEEFGLDEEKGPRQLVNPNKEIMVVKKNRVIVIDKKDKDKYMKKGWTLAEEGELDEAKYDLYHKDFSTAMQHSYKMAKKLYGITVDPEEIDDKVASGPKKPSEGKTNSYRLEGDKGAIQVQVYNKGGSKPFELNMYKEEVELGEEVSVKDFDALKKGDTVTVEYKSAMSSGKGTFAVTAKNKVAKGKVEKVTLKSTKNPGGVKYFLYKRDNKVGFAQGDMGASVVSFKKEEVEEGAAADARRAMRSDPEMKQRAFSKDVSATDDDEKAASKNIMMQLRKAVSLRSYDVEFADGKKQKVNQKIAQAVQNKYNSFRKPADKEKFQAQIAKSYKDMLKTIKSGYGEQKESILEKIDRKIKENKND